MQKLKKNKKGVFGLNAVQQFFAIILGIALLAYVIVIIMGTLQSSTILPQSSGSVNDEVGFINSTIDTLNAYTDTSLSGVSNCRIIATANRTSGLPITSGNYTVNSANCTYLNATATGWGNVSINYTYSYDSQAERQTNTILSNVSGGITGFFSSISPVYAILAVLVIILVLVVLVRVVQAPTQHNESPSL